MHLIDRRMFLKITGAVGVGALAPRLLLAADATTTAAAAKPQAAPWRSRLIKFPEKTEMILLTDRPPQLETPLKYFKQDLTPNEAFFVRWHLSGIPTSVDLATFRLSVGGHVDKPLSLSVDDLKKNFQQVSLVAVAQCSGNSRSFFQPRVAGGQWGNGAVGCAKWTGVRLKDLLDHAGVKSGAVDVSFAGLDNPPLADTAKFVKSLDLQHAADGEVMVAYAMNDADLPMLNGYPLRLIVPGWFATYWVKSLNQITVLNDKFKGFWMDKAYRIPKNEPHVESPQQLATDTIPINKHTLRSLFVTPPNVMADAGKPMEVEGLTFDDGTGVTKVELSADGGKSWSDTKFVGSDMGKYAWRRWTISWTPPAAGSFTLMCRATNKAGVTQTSSPQWNRSGYQRNVIEQLEVEVRS